MNAVDYDIVVIGCGPAGTTTARIAAERGLNVLLLDKKQELGAPIQRSGALSAGALEEAGINPSLEFIQEPIYGFTVYNEMGDRSNIDYRTLKPEKYGVGMGKKSLEDGTCEVHSLRFNKEIKVRTNVLIGADGLQSQVGKWAGLQTHIKMTELASCLQFVVDKVETNGMLEIVTGHEWAPGGYACLFPKGHGYAEVGLGVIRTMTKENAQWHLDHFIKNSFLKDRLKHARILEVHGGGVPLAAPLRTQFAENLILAGDAARHVNPITGGGIHTAMTGGLIAGKFLAELVQNGTRASAESLKGYQCEDICPVSTITHEQSKDFLAI